MRHRYAFLILIVAYASYGSPAVGGPTECPAPLTARSPLGNTGDSVQALILARSYPVRALESVKVIWLMESDSSFSVSAKLTTKRSRPGLLPLWGPQRHLGSSAAATSGTRSGTDSHRPATEYGSGWVFPTAGCWTFLAISGGRLTKLRMKVAPARL